MNQPSVADSPGMEPVIADNPQGHRFEAQVGGELVGFLTYHLSPGAMVLTHTEVDEAHEGQGVGSALAKSALDDVRSRGLSVVPLCSFVKSWIERHPDYADLG